MHDQSVQVSGAAGIGAGWGSKALEERVSAMWCFNLLTALPLALWGGAVAQSAEALWRSPLQYGKGEIRRWRLVFENWLH